MKIYVSVFILCLTALQSLAAAAWTNVQPQGHRSGVTAMALDSKGFLWAGTSNGLFNYDGCNFYPSRLAGTPPPGHVHALIAVDSLLYAGAADGLYIINTVTGISRRPAGKFPAEIRALLADGPTLWIGSLNGLYRYDTHNGSLTACYGRLPHKAVYALLKEPDTGNVFIGTFNGLAVMENGNPNRIVSIALGAPPTGAANTFVNALAFDRTSRRLWIGLEGALLSYDAGGVTAIDALGGHSVKTLAIGPGGTVLAGTDDGLAHMNPDGSTSFYVHDSRNASSIADNSVWSLITDSRGNIMAGTDAGISIMPTRPPKLIVTHFDKISGGGDANAIRDILRDRRGHLWLGGANGLIELDGDRNLIAWFKSASGPQSIGHPHVRDLSLGPDGTLWVATDGGLHHYDTATGKLVNHRISDAGGRHAANWVYGVIDDGTQVWTGSYLGGVHATPRANLLTHGHTAVSSQSFNTITTPLMPSDLVSSLVTDSSRNKWLTINADSALTRIDGKTGAVSRHPLPRYPAQILSADGRIWIASNGVELSVTDTSGKIVASVSLPASGGRINDVLAMTATPDEIIVSATEGVWAVDRKSFRARLLPLPAGQFSAVYCDTATASLLMADDRRLVEAPLTMLSPVTSGRDEQLRITGLIVNDIPDNRLLANLLDDGKISIPFDIGDASVEVATFDYTPDPSRRIAYSIDGGMMQMLADGTNRVPIARLPIGTHSVTVMIAGSAGMPLEFTVTVSPPWWASRQAITVYALTVLLAIGGVWLMMRRRAQKKLAEAERLRSLRMVNERLTFLSNISHDLKTPLSMIIGPVSQLRENASDPDLRHSLDTVYNAAIRLNTLVHRTVELNRLESGADNMLIFSRVEAVEFCRSILGNYIEANPAKHFVFTASAPAAYIEADAVKLESVLNNLLSNACKYSGPEATISTDVSTDGDRLKITVADDGLGIPADEHRMIFQRTFRSARTAHVNEGTGIGLYLLKKYVELHSGSIEVESRENQGTTMTVTLPLSAGPDAPAPGPSAAPDKRPKVLVVDDNSSIAAFLCEILGTKFNCVSACNGRAALAVAASMGPDTIVADEMMPVMTGLEMTRRLRENPRLASIPVILLTAKDDTATQNEAMEAGVDGFVAKPFDAPLLVKRVAKAVDRYRARQHEARVEALTSPAATVEIESVAERQLATLTRIIEEHIDNPELNVTFLSDKSGIHPKQLYRLVKKYVGITPVDYIRQTRLRRAAMLLGQRKFTVSEVMYMVGFSSTSYFSKCFSALYHCTPGQYAERRADGGA